MPAAKQVRIAYTQTDGPRQFLSIRDLRVEDLTACLDLARRMKSARAAGVPHERPLAGRHIALLFEKPSLRTRSTFMIAVRELGGDVIEPPADVVLGGRETVADVARNLERWVFGAVIRTFAQARLEAFAGRAVAPRRERADRRGAPVPGAGRLPDAPREMGLARGADGDLRRRRQQRRDVAGAGRNHARRARPRGDAGRLRAARSRAGRDHRGLALAGGSLETTNRPRCRRRGADAVYTDVWASMGQETRPPSATASSRPTRSTPALMSHAAPGALFMHCLPAHRGDEVTDEVIDSPASVVFDQAENRLHAQKALLASLGRTTPARS
jgi:ornithine carbamoyltransferase